MNEQKLAALVQALRAKFKRQQFTAGEFLAACQADPELHDIAEHAARKVPKHRTAAGVVLKRACGAYGELQLVSEYDGHVKAWTFKVQHDNDAAEIAREQREAQTKAVAKEAAKRQAYNVERKLTRSYVRHGVPTGSEPAATAEQCLTTLKELEAARGAAAVVSLLRRVAGVDKWADAHAVMYAPLLKEAAAIVEAVKICSDPLDAVRAGQQEALRATAEYERKVALPTPKAATPVPPERAARIAEIEAELERHGRSDVSVSAILEIDELRGSPWRFPMSTNPADFECYTDRRVFRLQEQQPSKSWAVFDT